MFIRGISSLPKTFHSPKSSQGQPPEEPKASSKVTELKKQIEQKRGALQALVTAYMANNGGDSEELAAQIEAGLMEIRQDMLELNQQLGAEKTQNNLAELEAYVKSLTESLKCSPQEYSQFLINRLRRQAKD